MTDRAAFRPFQTGLRVIEAARKAGPLEFRWRTEPYEYDDRPAIDLLTGSPRYRETVESGESLRAEIARHFEGARQFRTRREAHLLYPDRKPAVVAFVGGHDSGKTSILVELVPRLKAKGIVVGTIKHTTRDVDDDEAGKDSQRHAAAGAAVAALVTPGRTTSRRFGEEETFAEVISREFGACDLVLVEGYKSLPIPKIEVIRTGIPRPEVIEPVARISDGPFQGSVPTLSFGDWDAIVATVLHAAGLDRQNRDSANGSRKSA